MPEMRRIASILILGCMFSVVLSAQVISTPNAPDLPPFRAHDQIIGSYPQGVERVIDGHLSGLTTLAL